MTLIYVYPCILTMIKLLLFIAKYLSNANDFVLQPSVLLSTELIVGSKAVMIKNRMPSSVVRHYLEKVSGKQ